MLRLRNVAAVLAWTLVLALPAIAGPDDDRRPTETGGIWVQSIDDTNVFESHPVARTALDAKKIRLIGTSAELTEQLEKRAKAKGAIVVIDGAQMFANPTEAYALAEALVRRHGKNATYIFLNEPTSLVLADVLRDNPLRASGPINASGLVDRAIRAVYSGADAPERITFISRARAESVLRNEEMARLSTPSDFLPRLWPEGQSVVVHTRAPFDRSEGVPTTTVSALVRVLNAQPAAYVGYEILGGESTVVGNRMVALASELRAQVTRPVDFRLRVYAGGEDARSAVHKLVEQKTELLARLNGMENLPDSIAKPAVAFTAEVANLYRAPTTLDNEREVMVHYTRRGFLGMGGTPRVATFNVLYSGGRVYVDSKEDFTGIEVLSNKPGERPLVVTRGRGELLALDGPVAEIRVRLRGQDLASATSILLVDARNLTDVTNALFPTSQPNFTAAATDYMRGITEADGTAPRPGASGAAAVVAPAARRSVARIADPSVFDPLNQYFPPVNNLIRRDRPPYELPTQDLLRDFERKTLDAKRGMVVFVVPDGVNSREVLNRVLFEVTQAGTVPGLPRNQHFAELRASLVASKWMSETENRLEVVNQVSRREHVYLVSYDLTALSDLGKHTESPTNALGSLLPAMEDGRVTMITAATASGLEAFLRRNPEFRTVVGQVRVPDVKEAYVFTVMDAYSDREGRPRVPDAIKREFIELSERFSARGGQPERVLEFLSNYYPIADDLALSEINREGMRKVAAVHYGLTAEDFDPELKLQRINRVIEDLNTSIIGMDHIKGPFAEYLEHERRGFFRGQRYPSFLLTGPPALAKTYILRKMATGIVGDRFHEINMGGPAGQSIPVLYRAIADAVSKNADVVIFFDEIEKASREVQEALLKPMWDRKLDYQPNENSPQLETVSLRSVRFFAASNAGTRYLQEVFQRADEAELQKAIAEGREAEYRATIFDEATYRKHLERELIDTLLSRFEHRIFPVFPLSRGEFEALVALKVRELERQFSANDFVGPVRVVNGEQFAREFSDAHWSRTVDLRMIEGRIGEAFKRAVGVAQDRQGRAPGVQVPAGCDALLIELGQG